MIQSGGFKYFYGQEEQIVEVPTVYFLADQYPSFAHQHCNNPNLLGIDLDLIVNNNINNNNNNNNGPSPGPIAISAPSSSTSTTENVPTRPPAGVNNNGTSNGIITAPPGKEGISPSSSSSSHSNAPLLISGIVLLVGLLLLGYRSHPGYTRREKEGELTFDNMTYSATAPSPKSSYSTGSGRVDSYQTLANVDRDEVDIDAYQAVDEELAVRKYRFDDDDEDDATSVLMGKTGGSRSGTGTSKKYVFPGDEEDDDEGACQRRHEVTYIYTNRP